MDGGKKLLGNCFQLSTYMPKAQEFGDDLVSVNKNMYITIYDSL